MDAFARSLHILGEHDELAVPFFQRHYVWEKENWEELLNSFEDSEITPFLGSIILKEESSKKSTIIDGQQRLTTITILAKAIYDSLSEENKQHNSGIRNGIENYLFYRRNSADNFEESSVRITHSRKDREQYERIIKAEILPGCDAVNVDLIDNQSTLIEQCYQFYRKKLSGRGDDALKHLFNSIFNKDRKVFILITLKYGDVNEQTIFDTINRAGVRLSTADIIKNNFYKCLLNAAGTDEDRIKKVDDTYKSCWEEIFDSDRVSIDIWETKRMFGNVKHTNLEFLLYCVACIKWGEDSDMFKKLEKVYADKVDGAGYIELLELAKEIKDYALIFKKYILDFKASLKNEDHSEYFKYKENIRRLLLILEKFEVQMFYPYVIMRLKDVNQDETDEQLARDFWILESFVMRRKVSAKGTNDYTKKCYEIIKHGIESLVVSDLSASDAGISDLDMKEKLAYTTSETAKMILFWIELRRREQISMDVDALEYNFTLEHVMPVKWEECWSDIVIKKDGEVLPADSEEGIYFRNTALQSIGNKTLLTCNLNASLKNKAFSQKIEGDGERRPGYRKHTSLLVTKEIVELADGGTIWDEQQIAERKERIYREFAALWPCFTGLIPSPDRTHRSQNGDTDPVLDDYTDEQLANPLILLDTIPISTELASSEETETVFYHWRN